MEIVSRSKINYVQKSSSPEFWFAVTGTSLRILGAKVHFPLLDLEFCAHSVLRNSAAFPQATPVADRDDTLVRNRLFHKRTLHFYCVGVCSPGFEILLTGNLDKYPHLSRVTAPRCPLLLPKDLRPTFGGRAESATAFLSVWLFAPLFQLLGHSRPAFRILRSP